MGTVRVVLTDQLVGVPQIAKFVRMVAPGFTTSEALAISRDLRAGNVWETTDYGIAYRLSMLSPAPWEYTIIEAPNPWRDAYEARCAEYSQAEELARLGAEGDAAAAIEFCKRFLAGVMRNEAWG
jgi:hypothetical protein